VVYKNVAVSFCVNDAADQRWRRLCLCWRRTFL